MIVVPETLAKVLFYLFAPIAIPLVYIAWQLIMIREWLRVGPGPKRPWL